MPAWLSEDRMLIVYLVLLGVGVVAALALALLGEAGEPLALTPLSPAVLVACLTCFGGAGVLALRLFGFPVGLSLIAALLFAGFSATLFALLATVASRAAERRKALGDLVGALARVVTPIEPGRTGLIATNGSRPALTLPATSRESRPLPTGTTVVVTALHGAAAEVTPLPRDD